jgi:hypothetical protein
MIISNTILSMAIQDRNVPVARVLLEGGADIRKMNPHANSLSRCFATQSFQISTSSIPLSSNDTKISKSRLFFSPHLYNPAFERASLYTPNIPVLTSQEISFGLSNI